MEIKYNIYNLWDLSKALLRVKSTVLHAYVRKDQMSPISYLNIQLEKLEKAGKIKFKFKESRKKKMIENRNDNEINEAKTFFIKISKLVNLDTVNEKKKNR